MGYDDVVVSASITRDELRAFDEAIKRSKRFLNRSDALRYLIRRFVDEQGVSVTRPVEHPYGGEKRVEARQ